MGATVWPLVRIETASSFRRALPRFALAAAGVVLVVWSLTFAAALWLPWLLRPATALAVLLLAGERLRARVDYGRRRGLPPGSLSPLPTGPWRSQDFHARAFERHGPVFKTSHFVTPMVCVLGLERGAALLREHDASLDVPPLPFDRLVPGGFIRYMEPERHREFRRELVELLPSSLGAPDAAADAVAVTATLEALAAATGPVAPRPPLERLAFERLAATMLGIEPGTPELERMRAVVGELQLRDVRNGRVEAALDDGASLVRELLRRNGEAEAAADDTLVYNLVFLTRTSTNDVTGLLHWLLRLLTDEPAWLHRLRALDGAERADLARRVVLETLRLEQSEYLYRLARERVELGNGYVLPQGWLLRICVRESHRAAGGDTFDPDRFLGRPPSKSSYSPFGASRLACIGDRFTLALCGEFVSQLAGYDWAVASDGPSEFDGWHWRPSSEFRIDFSQRAQPAVAA